VGTLKIKKKKKLKTPKVGPLSFSDIDQSKNTQYTTGLTQPPS